MLLADQALKLAVARTMLLGESIPASGPVRITYVTNTGMAFGLLPGQNVALLAVSFAAITFMVWYFHRVAPRGWISLASLGLVLGGAAGNIVSRVSAGHVVDFIDVGIGGLRWPTFNLSDSAIVVGILLLLWSYTVPGQPNVEAVPDAQDQQPRYDESRLDRVNTEL